MKEEEEEERKEEERLRRIEEVVAERRKMAEERGKKKETNYETAYGNATGCAKVDATPYMVSFLLSRFLFYYTHRFLSFFLVLLFFFFLYSFFSSYRARVFISRRRRRQRFLNNYNEGNYRVRRQAECDESLLHIMARRMIARAR